uniref:Uncharacterized protein n=1 Tax=Molossus molossus TaxID=27622 RepID=A0A7J8BM06_MOLMO|nr:hypothetical protein HJG59_010147 [Molossus molossus]
MAGMFCFISANEITQINHTWKLSQMVTLLEERKEKKILCAADPTTAWAVVCEGTLREAAAGWLRGGGKCPGRGVAPAEEAGLVPRRLQPLGVRLGTVGLRGPGGSLPSRVFEDCRQTTALQKPWASLDPAGALPGPSAQSKPRALFLSYSPRAMATLSCRPPAWGHRAPSPSPEGVSRVLWLQPTGALQAPGPLQSKSG